MRRVIAWFTANHVAANLLMFVDDSRAGSSSRVRDPDPAEELPRHRHRRHHRSEWCPTSARPPKKSKEGVCIRIEEAIQGINGIERISSTADRRRLRSVDRRTDFRAMRSTARSAEIKNAGRRDRHLSRRKPRSRSSRSPLRDQARRRSRPRAVGCRQRERTPQGSTASGFATTSRQLPGITQVDLHECAQLRDRRSRYSEESAAAATRLTFKRGRTMPIRQSSLDLPGGSTQDAAPARSCCAPRARPIAERSSRRSSCSRGPTAPASRSATSPAWSDGFEDVRQADLALFDGEPAVLVQGLPGRRSGRGRAASRR